jgi:uncharacterized membrane protein YvbJ
MKKSKTKKPKSKKFKIIIATIVVVFIILFLIGSNQEVKEEVISDDMPLEDVREQASNAFLVNSKEVNAEDIDLELG